MSSSRNFGKVSVIYSIKLWFLFFYAFCRWSKLRWTNLYACMKRRIIKLRGKRTSALKFACVQISDIKHSTVLSVIYRVQMNNMEQASTIFFDEHFHLMKYFGQIWPVLGVDITASHKRQANLRSLLFWPSFPFPWALTAKSRSLSMSYDEKFCLVQTQVRCDFHRFQLTVRNSLFPEDHELPQSACCEL